MRVHSGGRVCGSLALVGRFCGLCLSSLRRSYSYLECSEHIFRLSCLKYFPAPSCLISSVTFAFQYSCLKLNCKGLSTMLFHTYIPCAEIKCCVCILSQKSGKRSGYAQIGSDSEMDRVSVCRHVSVELSKKIVIFTE
jgi:hypothetical protein